MILHICCNLAGSTVFPQLFEALAAKGLEQEVFVPEKYTSNVGKNQPKGVKTHTAMTVKKTDAIFFFRKAQIAQLSHTLSLSRHTAKLREDPCGIVRRKNVHQGVANGRGIAGPELAQHAAQLRRIPVARKSDQPLTQRVIHQAVQLCAKQITPPFSVGDLGGGIFPDLTEDHPVPTRFAFDTDAKRLQKGIGKLVRHVQSPSPDTHTPIARQNAVLGKEIFADLSHVQT